MDVKQYYEAIDACQPSGDELRDASAAELRSLREALAQDPALQQLRQRTARFDSQVGEVFQKAPAPVGLEDRLLAAVLAQLEPNPAAALVDAAAESTESLSEQATDETSPDSAVETLPSPAAGWTRRRFGYSVAAAAALAAGVACWFALPHTIDSRELVDQVVSADGWDSRARSLEEDTWNTKLAEAPAAYPLDRGAVSSVRAWRPFPTSLDRDAVEYDLRRRTTEPRAALFVLKCADRVTGLGAAVPHAPQSTTGNLVVAAWSSNQHVYVLAIEGDKNRYNALVQLPQYGMASSRLSADPFGVR
ncbi:hypothetical protein [Lignipirellula cremea]|uniref:Uncharacterized protein n=1 Tax=Lignipirellula cremea TaxID=2528010 RepID=A0A518E0K9_9BACT|nr:hypothetical protein [Lignipirellula cremea]QDU97628.1 hypothetical protein Pla8534_54780 [Lignipirellula cremea]